MLPCTDYRTRQRIGREARLTISHELGHAGIEIAAAYLGKGGGRPRCTGRPVVRLNTMGRLDGAGRGIPVHRAGGRAVYMEEQHGRSMGRRRSGWRRGLSQSASASTTCGAMTITSATRRSRPCAHGRVVGARGVWTWRRNGADRNRIREATGWRRCRISGRSGSSKGPSGQRRSWEPARRGFPMPTPRACPKPTSMSSTITAT